MFNRELDNGELTTVHASFDALFMLLKFPHAALFIF